AERLAATYRNEKEKRENPIIIHRAILGSIERFIAVLIEHTGGNFPVWLAPVQAIILPVSEKFNDFACEVYTKLKAGDVRVDVDMSKETLNKKIRAAELQKIPYIIVVGEKEKESGKLAVRCRGEQKIKTMAVADLTKEINRGKIKIHGR
ncbi:MAG: threonyl-tRNA synthetase, partial [Candidatus Berkelbacteria bacterium Licking1014_2]